MNVSCRFGVFSAAFASASVIVVLACTGCGPDGGARHVQDVPDHDAFVSDSAPDDEGTGETDVANSRDNLTEGVDVAGVDDGNLDALDADIDVMPDAEIPDADTSDEGGDEQSDAAADGEDAWCGDCTGGKLCIDGECMCPDFQQDCSGLCTDMGTDDNCDGCGDACTGGRTCIDTSCQCPAGQTECDGTCTPLGTNTNCSECGDSCPAGQRCKSGECADTVGMVLISSGSFWMGNDGTTPEGGAGDEIPYHEVTLSGYYMDATEVTQAAYQACVDAGQCGHHMDDGTCYYWNGSTTIAGALPSAYRGDDKPIVCVDFNDATAYCAWAGKRLPTEAEWEKAARGIDGRQYPWGSDEATCDYATMSGADGFGCGTGATMDACGRSPAGDSPYGLCDMSGNVWEWASDWYDDGYYEISPASDPQGPSSGTYRCNRGGAFNSGSFYLRASYRSDDLPSEFNHALGFRCAKSE